MICIGMTQKKVRRSRLSGISPLIRDAGKDYAEHADAGRLNEIPRCSKEKSLLADILVANYTGHMVPKKSRGREIYNRIIRQPKLRTCPLCSVGKVKTLDHFLPKEHYPLLAVNPDNLVPACRDCQGEKMSHFPDSIETQLLHPYFDEIDSPWLAARVNENRAVIEYYVSAPAGLSKETAGKACTHFTKLNLGLRFSEQAASRIGEMRYQLKKLYEAGSHSAVSQHLLSEHEGHVKNNSPQWLSAMHKCIGENHWFCNGGFLNEFLA